MKKLIKKVIEQQREVGDKEIKIIMPTKELIKDIINFQMLDLAENEIRLLNEYNKIIT